MITWKWGLETTGHKNLRVFYKGDQLAAITKRVWPHGHNWTFGVEGYVIKDIMKELRYRLGERLAKEFAGVDR